MATCTFNATIDATWSNAGNWTGSAKPAAGDDVVISAAVAAMNIDETAPATGNLLSFNGTGPTGAITISGAGALSVGGTFTLDSGVTWTHSGGLALNLVAHVHLTFAGVDMSSDVVTMNMTPTAAVIYNFDGAATTFGVFNISMLAERRDCYVDLAHNISLTDSSAWTGGGTGADDPTIRPMIRSSAIGTGTRTITIAAAKTLTATDIDIQDLAKAGTGTWTPVRVGDCGGNTAGMCSAPKTVYADIGTTALVNWYDNNWATSTGGGDNALVNFPLPQDTACIDNLTWDATGKTIYINYPRIGIVNSAGLTEIDNGFFWTGANNTHYGSLLFSASTGVGSAGYVSTFDARICDPLQILLGNDITFAQNWITIDSYGGTVQLASALTHTGTFTLIRGTFDRNGQVLTTAKLSSTGTIAREFKDVAGGGNTIITAVTGNAIDFTNDTNLTISNAPAIQIGDSTKTLTAAVTLILGSTAKTFGALSFKKHAGNFAYIVTGVGNTFGAVTQETPDATYQFNGVTWPASETANNVASYGAVGTSSYDCFIQSSSAGSPAHLSDVAGTNTFSYCTIQDMHVLGGAVWDASDGFSHDVSGNDGWTWPGVGLSIPVAMATYNQIRRAA